MLYLEPDMAGFAADAPLAARPGTRFNYSSATAVLLSRIWMDRLESAEAAPAYPRRALFGPLGMQSAVMETDARGTFVGSSYMYATARDRSEEHTSELQSLMRISYAVFCLTKKINIP